MIEFGTTRGDEQAGPSAVAQGDTMTPLSTATFAEVPFIYAQCAQGISKAQSPSRSLTVKEAKEEPNQSSRLAPIARTAAQELVAKRLRILNKKIQRFRSYQGGGNLNADQKAGIASLPALEAAAKELDDLASGLESISEEEATKGKAAALAAERRQKDAGSAALEAYKNACFPLLAGLIRNHAILRPAMHPAANFMASELPDQLQTLSRSDLETLDHLYDMLKSGDIDKALETMQSLSGKYEWTTTVGRVLRGDVDGSEVKSSGSTPVFSPPSVQPAGLSGNELIDEQVFQQADERLEVFRSGPEVVDQPMSPHSPRYNSPAKAQMSFIQLSELVDGDDLGAKPLDHEKAIEESPSSGIIETSKPMFVASTETPVLSHSNQQSIAKLVGLSWADDDEDHSCEEELARIRAQFNMPPLEPVSAIIAPVQQAALPTLPSSFRHIEQFPAPASRIQSTTATLAQGRASREPMSHDASEVSVEQAPKIAQTHNSRQRQQRPPSAGRGRGRGGLRTDDQAPGRSVHVGPIMEDDGFQIATRRRGPQFPQGQGRGTSNNNRGGKRGSAAAGRAENSSRH